VLYAVVLFTNIIMNQSIKNLKTAVGLGFEERKEIKQLGPPRPNLKICKQNLIKGKTVVSNFNRGMYNNASWLCACDVSNLFFSRSGVEINFSDVNIVTEVEHFLPREQIFANICKYLLPREFSFF
jgi:hypothetical protein